MVKYNRWEFNGNKIDTCDYDKDILEVADAVGYVVYVNWGCSGSRVLKKDSITVNC